MAPKSAYKKLRTICSDNKERIKNAPVLIVSTFERGKSGFFQGNQTNEVGDGWGAYDNGLSNCYLILKARAMGFDTLIMGMRDADKLRELFAISPFVAKYSIVLVTFAMYNLDPKGTAFCKLSAVVTL